MAKSHGRHTKTFLGWTVIHNPGDYTGRHRHNRRWSDLIVLEEAVVIPMKDHTLDIAPMNDLRSTRAEGYRQ